jgi:hypothetical protein
MGGILIGDVWMGPDREPVNIYLCGSLSSLYFVVEQKPRNWMSCPSLLAAVDGALNLKEYGQFDPPGAGDFPE